MRLIILESPFRGRDQAEQELFRRYRQHCIRDAIERGESPYASHAIIPGALDDAIPEERQRGIEAGYAWWDAAEAIVFYLDHGMSTGMQYALDRAIEGRYNIEERHLVDYNRPCTVRRVI
jgi:hypothetical protein